jgi:hypothetical protein
VHEDGGVGAGLYPEQPMRVGGYMFVLLQSTPCSDQCAQRYCSFVVKAQSQNWRVSIVVSLICC